MKLRAMVALLLAGGLFAYYPFLRYNTRNAPFVGAASKFDLAALPNKTVYFYISETGPQTLLPGDSQAAIYSQIRAAARVWNDVDTSDLRIAFGGVRQAGFVTGATPGIDVSFEDLPPGVLSRGGPVLVDDDGAVAQQAFIPILRSVVELPRNFTTLASPCPCPSWSDYFFTSVVHEFGHALGLQHTFTSSVMSILRTRGTTKAKALGADDIAGLSSLYPTRAFAANFGVISGRITSGGAGVAYASVVAVSPAGAAVSTLTHPDGTYRIEGVPAGTYVVYAQNLPPDGDIVQALDADRRLVPLSPVFDTTFFPAGRDASSGVALPVRAGAALENINITVANRRTPLSIYSLFTLGFPGQVAVHPGIINVPGLDGRSFVLVNGPGLLGANGQPVPGLAVSILGGTGVVTGVRPYEPNSPYLRVDVAALTPNDGPNHLVFSTPTEVHVLPGAFNVLPRPAPQITSVTATGPANARVLTISGSGFTSETKLLVDGVAAVIRTFEEGPQRLTVSAPAAPFAHRASLVAANPDGQTSLFVQSAPAIYAYDEGTTAAPPTGLAAITQNATLPAGVEAQIEISGVNTNFIDGQVSVGVTSTDVVVRRAWVTAPNRILANVWVSPLAAVGSVNVTVFAGLATLASVNPLQIQPAGRQLSLTQIAGSPGTVVPVTVNNLTPGAPLSVVIGERTATVAGVNGNVIFVQIPAGMLPGPAILRIQAGQETSLPIVASVEPAPPQIIAAVQAAGNVPIDAARPARAGDIIRLLVFGLADAGPVTANRISIVVGGVEHFASAVTPGAGGNGHEVVFTLSAQVAPGTVPVTLTLDARTSGAINLAVTR